MYPITNEVMALFESDVQRKVLRITGTDKNGATISITDNNVMADSFQIDRYACNGEKLEVGTAIAAQLTLKLENGNGQYDGIVFEGAELFVEVGIADWTQSSPTVTYIPCGYFTPDEQPRRLSTISITALDRMTKFDAVVDGTQITTPITVANLVARVCTLRNVTLAQSITGLTNANVSLPSIPSGNSVTYRNLIAWCAGIMGTNAWIDWNGQLRFSWYNNATGYASTVDNRYSSDMYENDLTVTGVIYTTTGGIDIVEGTDDYALDLTGNTLAAPMITTILPALNTALNGFSYRPFTAAAVNAPYLWPMDAVTFTDKEGNDHTSLLTNVCFGLNGTTAMEARGMTYVLNRQKLPEGFTKEQAQLINEVSNQIKEDIDDSLTQQDIFNRLTENGTAQGLVLYNGQLYINASYIQSGTLVLGGLNNQNGTLKVLNAAGQEIGTWTKDGISIQRGDINLDSTGSIKVGFNAADTKYVLFNVNGMQLMLDSGAVIKTDSMGFINIPHYPNNTTFGTLNAAVEDGSETWESKFVPGYFWVGHRNGGVSDYRLEYDLGTFHVIGPDGEFKVDNDNGRVYTSYDMTVIGDAVFSSVRADSLDLFYSLPIASGGTGANTAAGALANLGAVAKAGDTMTGDLTVQHSGEVNIHAVCTNTNVDVALESAVSGNHGIWSFGYWNGSNYVNDEKWLIYRGTNGKVIFNDVLGINHGGTGATTILGAVQKLFDTGSDTITQYPNKPGIYRITSDIFAHMNPESPYGVLVIFEAVYGMHLYLDSYTNLYVGYSGDTFGEPSTWKVVTSTTQS